MTAVETSWYSKMVDIEALHTVQDVYYYKLYRMYIIFRYSCQGVKKLNKFEESLSTSRSNFLFSFLFIYRRIFY